MVQPFTSAARTHGPQIKEGCSRQNASRSSGWPARESSGLNLSAGMGVGATTGASAFSSITCPANCDQQHARKERAFWFWQEIPFKNSGKRPSPPACWNSAHAHPPHARAPKMGIQSGARKPCTSSGSDKTLRSRDLVAAFSRTKHQLTPDSRAVAVQRDSPSGRGRCRLPVMRSACPS